MDICLDNPDAQDDFGLDDDDSFAEEFLQAASQVESQTRTPAAPQRQQTTPLIIELDDSFDDAESASQALATSKQPHVTPCPPRTGDITDDDEFGLSDVNDDDLLAVLEASTSKHALSPDESRPTKRTKVEAAIPIDFAQINRKRPSALKYEPWTHVPNVREIDSGEPDFQDPDNIAALGLAARQVVPQSGGLPMTEAELQAMLRNAFTAGYMSQNRAWKRRYTYDFLSLPAGMLCLRFTAELH